MHVFLSLKLFVLQLFCVFWKKNSAKPRKYYLSCHALKLFLAMQSFMQSPVYHAILILPRHTRSVCRMLLLGISAKEQFCHLCFYQNRSALFPLSAGFWIDGLFVKYLQLYFLRFFSSKKYWKKLKTVKTYRSLHVSSESGVTAAEDFFHSDFLSPLFSSFVLGRMLKF